jgi:predicted TIM-barrel fold metal-dependent hydrolase
MKYSVISADNHIIEHRDLFTTRMPAKLRDRAPRVQRGADGGDGWSWNNGPVERTFGIEAVAGQGGQGGTTFKPSGLKWEEILKGNYDGAAHLADMAKDGVDAAVVFPQVSINAYAEPDREYGIAVMRAYNDWLCEDFTSADPKRLVGLCMLPVNDGAELSVEELERCVKKGAKGFFLPGIPARKYFDTYYDPLWKAASEADVPLAMHRTFGGISGENLFPLKAMPGLAVAGIAIRFFSAVEPFTHMIMTGAFQRFPKLKIVDAEVNCGWVPFWKETMDHLWEQQRGWANFAFDGKPSDALGRNVFVSVLDDYVGFEAMRKDPAITEMAMYSTDYPHSVSLWPNSRRLIPELTKGMDETAKAKVLAGNAVRVFGLR